jgi:hypothetical protein
MPDNVAAALAVLITAMATALLQYSTSHWGNKDRRIDDINVEYGHTERRHGSRERRKEQLPYDGPDRRRHHSRTYDGWDPEPEPEEE